MDRDQVLFRLFGKFCPEGTILSTEGSAGQELYFIQSGSVRLGAAHPEGGRSGLLGPGELFGEGSFFGRAPRSTRAVVVQDARLVQVNDQTLEAVVRHGPQIAQQIFAHFFTLTQNAIQELNLWTVEQIVHRIAPNLTGAAGAALVPADIAEHSGLLESDVVLVLEELRRRGCLQREGSTYRAPDAAQLQREIDRFTPLGERA